MQAAIRYIKNIREYRLLKMRLGRIGENSGKILNCRKILFEFGFEQSGVI